MDFMPQYPINGAAVLNGKPQSPKERLYVMRHGATALDKLHRSDGWLDLPLSDEGNQEIVETLDYLKYMPITTIFAAPLRRTQETAHILQSGIATHPKIQAAPEAMTWDLGTMSGDPKQPNKSAVRYLLAHPDKSPPNGESYDGFTGRFDPWFEQQKKDAKTNGPILLILSGSNIRRISELVMNDRGALDLDEAGLFVMMPEPDSNQWTAEIICGHRDEQDRSNNPEES